MRYFEGVSRLTSLTLALTLSACVMNPAAEQTSPTPSSPLTASQPGAPQTYEQVQFIYQAPQSFSTQDVDLSALAYLTLTLRGEGLSQSYTHIGEAYIPLNPDGPTRLSIPNIPLQPNKVRVATIQGYDENKQVLEAFTAKGIYRSASDQQTVEVSVDRRQLLTGQILEQMLEQEGFTSTTLDLESLQAQIDEATGFQPETQSFLKDPLLFNPEKLQQLFEENRLDNPTLLNEGEGQRIITSVFLRTPNGCAFEEDITLKVNAPGVLNQIISQGTKSPATQQFSFPPGQWTLSAENPSGQILATTQLQIGPTGVLENTVGSNSANAWNPGLSQPIPSYYLAERFAGGGVGDEYAAKDAYFSNPSGMFLQSNGTLVIADSSNHRIRSVTPDGMVHTIAGSGESGYSGDGGAATAAVLSAPHGITQDTLGNIYISDTYNHVIRKVSPAGIISTFAGLGTSGFSGDGGAAVAAQLKEPLGLDWHNGSLYITDKGNARIRRVDSNGIISTVAGNGQLVKTEGGVAAEVSIGSPQNIVVAADGTLYIADGSFSRVLRVSPTGALSTYIGQGTPEVTGNISAPKGLALDASGVLYVTSGSQVFKVNNNQLEQVAGSVAPRWNTADIGLLGDGGPATDAFLKTPKALLKSADGSLYIADTGHDRIRKIDTNGQINTIAGGGVGDNGPATNAFLDYPPELNFDATGNLLIADGRFRIRKINKDTGIIETIAGNGFRYFSGDGGPAVNAKIDATYDLLGRADGSIILASSWSRRLRKISAAGQIETLTAFQYPVSLAEGLDNQLYISDHERGQIYRYHLQTGAMTHVAGTGTYTNLNFNDNIPATQATLENPWTLFYEPYSHQFLISSRAESRVRSLDLSTGLISTLAGNGQPAPTTGNGTTGDGGLATDAPMNSAGSFAADNCGNVFLSTGKRIRKVDRQSNKIETVIGLANNTRLSNDRPWPEDWTITTIERRPDGSFYAIISALSNAGAYQHTVYKFTPRYSSP